MVGETRRFRCLAGTGIALRGFAIVALMIMAITVTGCGSSGFGSGKQVAAYFGNTGEWAAHEIYEDEITDYTEQFRARNYYEDDIWWARYLADNDLTPATWRESVIRQFADWILVEEKAARLGITADEGAVSQRIAAAKQQAGIDANDEKAWRDYLAQSNQTPEELEETYRLSSIEQQLFKAEIDTSTAMSSDKYDDYIKSNLADMVVRHYIAIEFGLDDEEDAAACAQELAALDPAALEARIDELIVQQEREGKAPFGEGSEIVDLGWDFLVDMDTIDPDMQLRTAKLDAGQLLTVPLKGGDAYRVVYCAEREQFDGVISYEKIQSESLKNIIANLTLAAHWSGLMDEYLTSLETSANIQVVPMPNGLPYDVEVEEGK